MLQGLLCCKCFSRKRVLSDSAQHAHLPQGIDGFEVSERMSFVFSLFASFIADSSRRYLQKVLLHKMS